MPFRKMWIDPAIYVRVAEEATGAPMGTRLQGKAWLIESGEEGDPKAKSDVMDVTVVAMFYDNDNSLPTLATYGTEGANSIESNYNLANPMLYVKLSHGDFSFSVWPGNCAQIIELGSTFMLHTEDVAIAARMEHLLGGATPTNEVTVVPAPVAVPSLEAGLRHVRLSNIVVNVVWLLMVLCFIVYAILKPWWW